MREQQLSQLLLHLQMRQKQSLKYGKQKTDTVYLSCSFMMCFTNCN
jgi:hypothetical protein